jgi:hypothetical protein
MRIEILYVPGCPNYAPAVEQVERVLSSESLPAEIRSIAVRTDAEARELMFSGSPTIRVKRHLCRKSQARRNARA